MQIVRRRGASHVVLAIPVAPEHAVDALDSVADEVICLETPADFVAVGQAYADFSQTTDREVEDLLAMAV